MSMKNPHPRMILSNSKTNCPICGRKKNWRYLGECPECTYPAGRNDKPGKHVDEVKNEI